MQKIKALIPNKIFFTKGLGRHQDKLVSFELALRSAGIENCNLVYVSSIFAPHCQKIPKAKGVKQLHDGQITFCVMAQNATNTKNQLISAAIGYALPENPKIKGYLSEHHTKDINDETCGKYAEKMAKEMLTTAFNYNKKNRIQSGFVSAHARGRARLWTTVLAVAVFAGYDIIS